MSQALATSLSGARAKKLLTIGKVLNLLTAEFSDLTPSKLRFLEEQGLITPQRTDSGYRKFTEADVERLRIVLELQRDKYLPLKVIRQYLSDLDEGKQPTLPGETQVNTAHVRQIRNRKFSLIDLVAETAITDDLIAQAQEANLIGQEPFEHADLEIARAIVHLQRFGIAPRHLKGLKAATEREIGIIEGVIAPVLRKNDTGARSRAAHYAAEIENQFAAIRSELIRNVISKIDQ
jgi:DNA-binding transcriptional MerR regulator